MDNQQARFILRSYRPNGQDANDPLFREALEQAQLDPEMDRYLAVERAFDAAIAAKLKEVQPPAHLKTSILAARKTIEPRVWWRRPAALAMAAALALLLCVAVFLFAPGPGDSRSFAQFQREMVELVEGLDRLDLKSRDMAEIKAWLAANQGEADIVLPPGMEGLATLGCKIIDWNGKKVTLICFHIGEEGLQHPVHLFVVNRESIANPPPETAPVFERKDGWMTANWSRGDRIYMLAGVGNKEYLQRYF